MTLDDLTTPALLVDAAALETHRAVCGELPAHVDPTVAYHERMHLVREREVLESWPVDLRGW